VTLAASRLGGIRGQDGLVYGIAQIGGGIAGAIAANLMFSLPAVEMSTKARWGGGLWLGRP